MKEITLNAKSGKTSNLSKFVNKFLLFGVPMAIVYAIFVVIQKSSANGYIEFWGNPGMHPLQTVLLFFVLHFVLFLNVVFLVSDEKNILYKNDPNGSFSVEKKIPLGGAVEFVFPDISTCQRTIVKVCKKEFNIAFWLFVYGSIFLAMFFLVGLEEGFNGYFFLGMGVLTISFCLAVSSIGGEISVSETKLFVADENGKVIRLIVLSCEGSVKMVFSGKGQKEVKGGMMVKQTQTSFAFADTLTISSSPVSIPV